MKLPSNIKKLAFLQALGITLYCSLIGSFMLYMESKGGPDSDFAPIAFLLLFSVSVLTCALTVFYNPFILFFDGKKKEAINLILYTTCWLFSFLLIFLSIIVFIK